VSLAAKAGWAAPVAVSARHGDAARARRSFWQRQVRQWHWVSSAICLVGILGFAITGITLNHAADIAGTPETTTVESSLPGTLMPAIAAVPSGQDAAVPAAVVAFVAETMAVDLSHGAAEWSDDEVYVALPRPGGDAFLTIDRASGAIEYQQTDRGWISYLNDLHKGRDTGRAWKWFLDVFAAGCVVFCVTGLLLLQLHARQRPTTWPAVGLGLIVPVVIALFFIH
jgi:hypothetical protein